MPLSLHKKSPTNQRLQFVSCGLEQLQFKQPQHQKWTRLGGCGFKIGTLPLDYFWQGGRRIGAIFKLPTPIQFEKPSVFAAFLCVWMKKKKSPCHSQVMIPSVKLDFSHVQAKCGSLDKIQHAAGGGNVSDISNNPSLQALSFLTNLFIQVWIIVVECFSSFSITYSIFTKHTTSVNTPCTACRVVPASF